MIIEISFKRIRVEVENTEKFILFMVIVAALIYKLLDK